MLDWITEALGGLWYFLTHLFDTTGWPRRWECGTWEDAHGWLHVASDLGVWSAYVAIPCVLIYFALHRRDLPFQKVFWLFGAFILACGTTHLMEAIIFWHPVYRLAGLIKLITAVVSWGTVVALIPIVPQALSLRSPKELERLVRERTAELAQLNESLRKESDERKRIQEALREKSEWLEVTLSSIGDAVITTDIQGRITFMNPVAERTSGWTRQHTTGVDLKTVFNIVNEQTRQTVENPVDRVLREQTVVGLANHTLLITRQGTEVPIDDSAAPIKDSDGKIAGVVLVFRDISERRRSERARLQLAAIVESSNDAIVGESLTGVIETWNAGAQRLFGYMPEEVIGKPVSILVPSGLGDELPDLMDGLVRGERIEHLETTRVKKDGSEVTVLVSISPIKDESGQIVGASKIARDISDRKQFERALQEADRRKDEFLAMLSHELRNPLSPISNSIELIQSGIDQATTNWAIEVMERQVRHLTRLVDDLLDVSRIMRGKIDLRKEPVELRNVVTHGVEAARHLIEGHKHDFSIDLPAVPIWLEADPVRLAQIISNVLNNAAKYTPAGGRIRLSAGREDGQVLLRIEDNGAGIPPDQLTQVFELFMQGDCSIERSQGGLGIGLTVVRRLTELHGGSVTVHSPGVGQGTEFIIRLPMLTEPHVQQPAAAPAKRARATSCRVLIVDDNVDLAQTLARLARSWGHEVEMSHDGRAAIEAAETFRPHVVLLDVGLPQMNGYDVARHLRKLPEFAGTLLIAITGYGQSDDRRRAEEAGFDRHMVKPVPADELEQLLADVDGQPATGEG